VVNASANTRVVKMKALWKTPKEFPIEPSITLRFINILTASITNMMKIKGSFSFRVGKKYFLPTEGLLIFPFF
jgi:hypothetical protein